MNKKMVELIRKAGTGNMTKEEREKWLKEAKAEMKNSQMKDYFSELKR